ncbi:MAG: NEAT domain-containing protein [Oscillospiraceae bacterium]|nr:NEAT domain-containing protein [Oscillospiraceae bacterium]
MKKNLKMILGSVLISSLMLTPLATASAATSMNHPAEIDAMSSATTVQPEDTITDGVTKREITLNTGIAIYKVDVYVSSYGAMIENIVDKTTDAPGWTANVWEVFKEEGGLTKYVGKTYAEIKNMPLPSEMPVMGGTDSTPPDFHNKILELITELEQEPNAGEKTAKTELAKAVYEARSLYEQKDGDEYESSSMAKLVEKYEKAMSVLKDNRADQTTIYNAVSELREALESLAYAPADWTRYKHLMEQAETIIANEQEYTRTSIAQLRQVLSDVKQEAERGGNTKSKVKTLESKLENALNAVVKQSQAGNRFTINAKIGQAGDSETPSMANAFMNPHVLLIENEGESVYQISFKKDKFQGITANILTVKHIENGKEVLAEESTGIGEYDKVFTIKRQKSGEKTIDVLLGAKMAGPDVNEMPAVLVLDTTSKRAEGESLKQADKAELKKVIDENKTTYDEVLAGEYKEEGSRSFLNLYNKALMALEDVTATEETVDSAAKYLKSAKEIYLVPKKVDDFTRVLVAAEEKKAEDYTEKSYAVLKTAIDEGNANWSKRSTLTNAQLQQLIDKLEEGMQGLKPAGTPEEPSTDIPPMEQPGTDIPKNEINLQNGEYTLKGALYNFNSPDKLSMANQGLEQPLSVIAKDGTYRLRMNMNTIKLGTSEGALSKVSYFEGNLKNDSDIIAWGTTSDGTKYPKTVEFPVAYQADSVTLEVFVPIMEKIAPGHGTQKVLLKLDWSSLQTSKLDETVIHKENGGENTGHTDKNGVRQTKEIHQNQSVPQTNINSETSEIKKSEEKVISATNVQKESGTTDINSPKTEDCSNLIGYLCLFGFIISGGLIAICKKQKTND